MIDYVMIILGIDTLKKWRPRSDSNGQPIGSKPIALVH